MNKELSIGKMPLNKARKSVAVGVDNDLQITAHHEKEDENRKSQTPLKTNN